MSNDWPFDQPRNCAVYTLRQIIKDKAPILHVTHDSDDHGWQFLGWETPNSGDAALVCLSDIVEMDPSVLELADLLPGWHAWRKTVDDPWTKEKNPDD